MKPNTLLSHWKKQNRTNTQQSYTNQLHKKQAHDRRQINKPNTQITIIIHCVRPTVRVRKKDRAHRKPVEKSMQVRCAVRVMWNTRSVSIVAVAVIVSSSSSSSFVCSVLCSRVLFARTHKHTHTYTHDLRASLYSCLYIWMRVSGATCHTHPRGLALLLPFPHTHVHVMRDLRVVDTHARTSTHVYGKMILYSLDSHAFSRWKSRAVSPAWNVCVCVYAVWVYVCRRACERERVKRGGGGRWRRRLRAKVTHNHRNCDIIECAILSSTPHPLTNAPHPNKTKERTFKQHSRDMKTCYRICTIFISITSYFVRIQITYIQIYFRRKFNSTQLLWPPTKINDKTHDTRSKHRNPR